jgi:hypothetical protein
LLKQNAKKRFFTLIGDWLNGLSTVPNERLRETLYNIEAFRADAVSFAPQPQSDNKTQTGK